MKPHTVVGHCERRHPWRRASFRSKRSVFVFRNAPF